MTREEDMRNASRFWGAVCVVKMCALAARLHPEEDISDLPQALEFAEETITEIGQRLFLLHNISISDDKGAVRHD